MVYAPDDGHPSSTNRAQRGITNSFMRRTMLPLRQAGSASRKDLHDGTGMLWVASVNTGVHVGQVICQVMTTVIRQILACLSDMHTHVLSAAQQVHSKLET